MSLYDVLGVAKDATKQAIKTAYRSLAQKAHPDREGGDAEKFHEIQLAYDVLSDDGKRERYDATGETKSKASTLTEAEQLVMQHFAQSIASGEEGDILESLRDFLYTGKDTVEAAIAVANRELEELQKQQGRVTSKTEENLFSMILDQKIDRKQQDIEALSVQLDVIEQAENLADDYIDTAAKEPEPEVPYFSEFDRLRGAQGGGRNGSSMSWFNWGP